MSDIIKLLPDSVANQIAAGEVIQRPASVVKELVENSVDAGATAVQIIIKDAGRTLIQIVDNGCGMSVTDARMAFERHSTSKITSASDLFSLNTMGFRGEALASIAAVAQIDLKTMRHGDTIGTRVQISGSKVENQEPVATTPGTNMMVKNLFFNVPARRKFLKKDSVELSNIIHEFERLALVNPEIELTLIHNDAVLHQLLKGSLKQRIGGLFGKGIEKQLIPVETQTSIVRISGFVGLPENARKRGALQYFFVNGRNMRHPYFHKAVIHCYENLIRADEQPNYFLNFEVDPATIDVNIHPTKNEIKFENEQPIWQIIVAAIKESLGKFNAVPSIDFDSVDMPDIPAFNPDSNAFHGTMVDTSYNPFSTQPYQEKSRPSGINSWKRESLCAVDDWEKLYQQFQSSKEIVPESTDVIASGANSDVAAGQIPVIAEGDVAAPPSLMQLKGHYILSQNKNGLLIVEQRRAHIRVLFEKFISCTESGCIPSQKVIFPEMLVLSPAENVVLENILDQVTILGFDLSYLGDNSWAVNGVPSVESINNHVELLREIVNDVSSGVDITIDGVREKIALNMARSAAIPSGRQMTASEMEHLLSDLFCLSTPGYTPDGLKVVSEISLDEISKLFS